MELARPNKKLESEIQDAVKNMRCPVHNKPATVTMADEKKEVLVDACCPFFKKDILLIGERMRKDYIFRAQKTAEREERERIRQKYGRS